MARRMMIDCDICGEQPTQEYAVTTPAGTADLDLCDKHSGPLVKLFDRGRPRLQSVRLDGRSSTAQLEAMVRGVPDGVPQ